MKSIQKTLGILAFSSLCMVAQAQDGLTANHDLTIAISEVALVDLEATNTAISLSATAPTEAGLPISWTGATNSDIWLNYSSIKHSTNDPTRTISAKLSATVAGVDIIVTPAAIAGTQGTDYDGTIGTSAGAVTLGTADATVISGIGSAYTGDGQNKGHNLVYSVSTTSSGNGYADLDAAAGATVEVTYTISDN